MFKSRGIINHTLNEFRNCRKYNQEYCPTDKFRLQRALIITKLTAFEYEQLSHTNLNAQQLEQKLSDRGTHYDKLLQLHHVHKEFEKKIVKSFLDAGCEVKVTNRTSLCTESMKWADILVPVGGDGTFLLAAGRASPLFQDCNLKLPFIGFNSDPKNSEGRLMLPHYFSDNTDDAVKKIKSGNFHWMRRSRIRTTLLSNNGQMSKSADLHRHYVSKMEHEKCKAEDLNKLFSIKYKADKKLVLPYLALNEVFIGETLASRVSNLEIVVDHSDVVNKTKCSGLCVSTGSGSTSWHTSINRTTKTEVEDLIKLLPKTNGNLDNIDAQQIADMYNQHLLFLPDDLRLCYSVREQICVGVWPKPKTFPPRSFVKGLFVQSLCVDASLVIDGSTSYCFNEGAKALLEVHPEDALLTITLN